MTYIDLFEIYGGNTYIPPDSMSHVSYTLVSNLALVTINAYAGEPYEKQEGKSTNGVGLRKIHNSTFRDTLSIEVEPFTFPEGKPDHKALMSVLSNDYIYIRQLSGYPVALCSSGYVLAIAADVESSREDGTIAVQIEAQALRPNGFSYHIPTS